MSTLRTTNVIHGSSAISNIVLDNQGRAIFGPDSPAGRAALYVNAQNNRVGVNTESPTVALDVDGAINATGNVAIGGTLDVTGNVVFSGTLDVTGNINSTGSVTGTNASFTGDGTFGGNLTIDDNLRVNSDTLFVNSTNNFVGINIDTPERTLDVTNQDNCAVGIRSATGDPTLYMECGGVNAGQISYRRNDASLAFGNNPSGVERMSLRSNGALLIGDTSYGLQAETSAKLIVVGNTMANGNQQQGELLLHNGVATVLDNYGLGSISFSGGDFAGVAARITTVTTGNFTEDTSYPGRLVFLTTPVNSTTPVERFSLDEVGNAIVGSTQPSNDGTIIDAFAMGGENSPWRRYFHFNAGGNRTLTFNNAGVQYFARVRVVGYGNYTPNVSEVEFIAAGRGGDLGHSHQVTTIGARTNTSITVATSDAGNTRTYTLTISHTDGLNKAFMVEVEMFRAFGFSIS